MHITPRIMGNNRGATCTESNPCGNNQVDTWEDCDNSASVPLEKGGVVATCTNICVDGKSYDEGILECTNRCTYDVTGCRSLGGCLDITGDGNIDENDRVKMDTLKGTMPNFMGGIWPRDDDWKHWADFDDNCSITSDDITTCFLPNFAGRAGETEFECLDEGNHQTCP